jgi:hypothetical protein
VNNIQRNVWIIQRLVLNKNKSIPLMIYLGNWTKNCKLNQSIRTNKMNSVASKIYSKNLKSQQSCKRNRFSLINFMEPEASQRRNLNRQFNIFTIEALNTLNTSKFLTFIKPSNVWKNVKNYSPLSK